MAHYGVGAAVVSHARRELKQRGLVYSDRWRGTFTA
jgi:DNA-binding transcriptional regulator YhcF (GntR family)